jgi:hypothetical protein
LDRAQPLTCHDGGADVRDDEVRIGDQRIAQEGEDAIDAAASDKNEPDIRRIAERAIEGEADGLASAQECAVEVGGE